METLMIVEDEKKIREDLIRLVKKSDVKIKRILECENGKEAWKMLQETQVDLVFTDIHMPEMNGCELTEAISNMKYSSMQIRPKVVIISGYENFQCAVELLKYGAKDYILKPASFEAMSDVLQRMEMEITREKKRAQEIDRVYRQHVRNLLKNGEGEKEDAWDILAQTFEERMLEEKTYRLVLTNPAENRFPEPYIFSLDKVYGDLYLIDEKQYENWKNCDQKEYCIGISQKHQSVCEIAVAYKEALTARKMAFVMTSAAEEYRIRQWDTDADTESEAERLLQLFFTNKIDTARKHFLNLCFEARHQKLCPVRLLEITERLTSTLQKNYETILSKKAEGAKCPEALDYRSMEEFLAAFENWIQIVQSILLQNTEGNRKNEKIIQALEYIQENYQKDLNLAMVSNHVSMNYSMFSNAFTKYTGVNFVNYLKDVRIAEAKKLLEETDKKIGEIGAEVGYKNDKHFMKTFKNICGLSPSEYRRSKELVKG